MKRKLASEALYSTFSSDHSDWQDIWRCIAQEKGLKLLLEIEEQLKISSLKESEKAPHAASTLP